MTNGLGRKRRFQFYKYKTFFVKTNQLRWLIANLKIFFSKHLEIVIVIRKLNKVWNCDNFVTLK